MDALTDEVGFVQVVLPDGFDLFASVESLLKAPVGALGAAGPSALFPTSKLLKSLQIVQEWIRRRLIFIFEPIK